MRNEVVICDTDLENPPRRHSPHEDAIHIPSTVLQMPLPAFPGWRREMKPNYLLLWLPAVVCILCPAEEFFAQAVPRPDSAVEIQQQAPNQAGSVTGEVKDPSGAVVRAANVEVENKTSGFKATTRSDGQGRFAFAGLSPGHYRLTVTADGFEVAIVANLAVEANSAIAAPVTLGMPSVRTEVEVRAAGNEVSGTSCRPVDASEQAHSRNTAEIAFDAPGVSLRDNGQLAAIPLLHGLGDERAKIVVDGLTVSSSCPNHMNPPLSYTPPSRVSQVTVIAGITPVSLGGDSLGGTVSVESRSPVFATGASGFRQEGYATGFYSSNGENYGGSLFEIFSTRILAMTYTGSWASSSDYTDGAGHKVTSTYSQTTDHVITLGMQGKRNLFMVEGGLHHTPYEGFPGAQMDLTRNVAESANFRYRRELGEEAAIDARIFWQKAWHSMNIGHDKSTFPMPMDMPMNTRGNDLGYTLHLELPISPNHTLRAGNELHRFVLDDTWPAVPGTDPWMAPDTFVNINNGKRLRLGTFAELSSRWSPKWTTLVGLRNDTVWMNTGDVQGYSMMYSAAADAFNAVDHEHADAPVDVAAIARYVIVPDASFEIGYARKTRIPNLYERYAWATDWMTSGMIGWFNDGNYYVGSVGLTPETANTISGTAALRGGSAKAWEVKLTPYYTRIRDFIDVDTLDTRMYGMSTFAQLRFANHDAQIYGMDFSGNGALWDNQTLGHARISTVGGWLHGDRLDTHAGLYQMMPVNVRITFDEAVKAISGGVGIVAVDHKAHVDPHRMEQPTPGYALVNIHAAWKSTHLEASGGVDNLSNRNYELPLGGINFDDFMASMRMGAIKPLTGRGRSAFFNLTARF